jgi:hypothetical protein
MTLQEQLDREYSSVNAYDFKRLPVKCSGRPAASTQDPLVDRLAGRLENAPKNQIKNLVSKSESKNPAQKHGSKFASARARLCLT